MGLFGDIFDLNHDGEMSAFESALEFAVFTDMVESANETDSEEADDNDFATQEYMSDNDLELLEAGIDPDEFEFMEDYERQEALEDAGLDPDDFDF